MATKTIKLCDHCSVQLSEYEVNKKPNLTLCTFHKDTDFGYDAYYPVDLCDACLDFLGKWFKNNGK